MVSRHVWQRQTAKRRLQGRTHTHTHINNKYIYLSPKQVNAVETYVGDNGHHLTGLQHSLVGLFTSATRTRLNNYSYSMKYFESIQRHLFALNSNVHPIEKKNNFN